MTKKEETTKGKNKSYKNSTWHTVSGQLMLTITAIFVIVITVICLFTLFVFYISPSYTRPRSNCPSTAELARLAVANIPTASISYIPLS